jgi:hypothetical protein
VSERFQRRVLAQVVEFAAFVVTEGRAEPDVVRTVTISLEPIRWHGSPVITWSAAGLAWAWAGLLAFVYAVSRA